MTGSTYSLKDAEELTCRLVAAQLEREELVAMRDAAALEATRAYAPDIDRLDAELSAGLMLLETWADASPQRFGSQESITLGGHRVGWRLGNYTASPAPKQTWAKILDALQAAPAQLRSIFLRTKIEANKEAMVSARETHAEELKELGVRIVQARRFYLDPFREGQADKTMTTEK